jgi:hypothetical protein
VIKHIEKQFQKKLRQVKTLLIDESTVGFKCKIIFETYNKKTKWGIRLFILAESDTGYVHSIIPNCRKLTGDVCNLPHSEKPFVSRTVLSLIDKTMAQCAWYWRYHHFTDIL